MMRLLKILLKLLLASFVFFLFFIVTNFVTNMVVRKTKRIDYMELTNYCRKHGLSERYAITVDFRIPSGRHRFFVCDLKKEEIVASSLCSHGIGKGSTHTKPVFSNEVGSLCSSLGHYKIMGRHKMSTSGLMSFRLKGLDATNSRAMERGILIHSAKIVSLCRWGIFPFYLPLNKRISSGCFTVDIDMMDIIDSLVKEEQRPILLVAKE